MINPKSKELEKIILLDTNAIDPLIKELENRESFIDKDIVFFVTADILGEYLSLKSPDPSVSLEEFNKNKIISLEKIIKMGHFRPGVLVLYDALEFTSNCIIVNKNPPLIPITFKSNDFDEMNYKISEFNSSIFTDLPHYIQKSKLHHIEFLKAPFWKENPSWLNDESLKKLIVNSSPLESFWKNEMFLILMADCALQIYEIFYRQNEKKLKKYARKHKVNFTKDLKKFKNDVIFKMMEEMFNKKFPILIYSSFHALDMIIPLFIKKYNLSFQKGQSWLYHFGMNDNETKSDRMKGKLVDSLLVSSASQINWTIDTMIISNDGGVRDKATHVGIENKGLEEIKNILSLY